MNSQTTLLSFLESTGLKVRVYDVGRRIQKISRKDFVKFEQQNLAYPFPLQQQAWFALSLNEKGKHFEPVIWFLRFPLDETGKLVLASRDYFLHRLLEANVNQAGVNQTGLNQASMTGQSVQSGQAVSDLALKDNPHVFKPRDDKLAMFHAILTYSVKAPASRFYEHAKNYFSGSQGWDQWNFVGFQGIADLAARFREDNNEQVIADAIEHLPEQPLEALCQCLENVSISMRISKALQERLDLELALSQPNASLVSFLCRAVSFSESTTISNDMLKRVLSSSIASNPEIVSAISARSWQWISEQTHARLYLDALADAEQETFNACIADLMYLPGIRNSLLTVIRDPQRPDSLGEKFGRFMQEFTRP